jgi:arylsulfatase
VVRRQFTHAIDVLPTVLQLAGIAAPAELDGVEQRPIEGTSFAYLLDDDAAAADLPERHTTQYFEMLGSRGIYHQGWKAVTFKPLGMMYDDGLDPDAPFEDDVWELFNVAEDPSECHDLATAHPGKLKELVDLWWDEARRYQVLPLDNRPLAALLEPRRPYDTRSRYVFWPNGAPVPETVTVNVRNRSHTIDAEVDGQGDGVLLAMGTVLGGWSLHVLDGRLRYVSNYVGKDRYVVEADEPIPPGPHVLGLIFETAGDFRGTASLHIDGRVVATGEIGRINPARYTITGGGITCGWEQGPPVGEGYNSPFRFTGSLRKVVVHVGGLPHRDPVAEYEAIMSEQ